MADYVAPIKYKQNRQPDYQYHNLLKKILDEGEEVKSQQEVNAKMIFGHQMRFPLENGFPLITERNISGKFISQALGELIAFLHGERTQEGLESFGCFWWKPWVTEEKCSKKRLGNW